MFKDLFIVARDYAHGTIHGKLWRTRLTLGRNLIFSFGVLFTGWRFMKLYFMWQHVGVCWWSHPDDCYCGQCIPF